MPPASLRALLAHAIDYAGLFPPASLALEPSLENYASYLQSAESWMLGAFILPLAQFDAAGAWLRRQRNLPPVKISALGPKAENAEQFLAVIESAAGEMEKFTSVFGQSAPIVQFEMPLPADVKADSLGAANAKLRNLGLEIFWEAPIDAARETIGRLRETGAGYKLRTGGVTAEAFPSGEKIAAALAASAQNAVPIKFTAGLHHPVRLFHPSVQTKMHGFLNVLGAGVLAAEHNWDEKQTAAMLADETADSFSCDDDAFRWRDWKITTAQIEQRRRFVTSLGSCSFDEPRDDLRALDLL